MIYERDHPLATLPSDEGDNASLMWNNLNFANQHLEAFEPFVTLKLVLDSTELAPADLSVSVTRPRAS
eukprot:2402655-Pleurochrysis_carterae.AAC.2